MEITMAIKLGKYDLPRDYRTIELHDQTVEVRVYATSTKSKVRPKMTKSSRTFKRAAMSMGEKRREGFCK
jgi:hypothetical protein